MLSFYVINHYFNEQEMYFMNDKNIKYVNSIENINDVKYYIIDVINNNFFEHSLFKNSLENIDILNNKSKFSHFMKKYYPNYFSKIFYYEFDDYVFYDENYKNYILIEKKNYGSSGKNVNIIENIQNPKNCVITEYVNHETYYSSHHIVLNGKILHKYFFKATNNEKNFINKGPITNYEVLNEIENEEIFENIFLQLSYSGFINCDFTVKDKKIIFFEINPRIGGSLLKNYELLNIMMYKLYENLNVF